MTPDHHTTNLDRRAHLQPADIIKTGQKSITGVIALPGKARHLEGQHDTGKNTRQHETSDRKLYFAEFHQSLPKHDCSQKKIEPQHRQG